MLREARRQEVRGPPLARGASLGYAPTEVTVSVEIGAGDEDGPVVTVGFASDV